MEKMKVLKKLSNVVYWVIVLFCLLVCIVGRVLFSWYEETFGVTIAEILFTIKAPMNGADAGFLSEAITKGLIAGAIFILFSVLLVLTSKALRVTKTRIVLHNRIKLNLYVISNVCLTMAVVIGAVIVFTEVDETLQIRQYLQSVGVETSLYEDYYVKPDINSIVASNPKNLIHIYLESMETTTASVVDGGSQPEVNYIPNLTRIAADNVSFSDTDKLGGYTCITSATGWTTAALFASESGLPFRFPMDTNKFFDEIDQFASGVTTIGDILEAKGYYQEFLCGSDSSFGGRNGLFTLHGDYNIFDVYDALDEGYIEQQIGWGVEDHDLYRIAKDELTRISALNKPFNLTMLTVDTHHVDGHICGLCGDEYPEQLANVLVCADNQIQDFLDWCALQPWYADTVIVIQGDHTRMDTALVGDYEHRRVYNCFINADYDESMLDKDYREFTTMDMCPTILSAMGFEIPGDRLGIGTDLFSDRPTLAEELGMDYLQMEIPKNSKFYIDEFS